MDLNNTENYRRCINKVLISQEEIAQAVKKAGALISSWHTDKPLVLISVLKGSFVFLGDIVRAVDAPCEVEFMAAKSYYESTDSSGVVTITMDLNRDIKGCDVVIVEDIIDTGRTLRDVMGLLRKREPASLRVVTLLDKPDRRIVDLKADYALFTIPDLFVIGYGLDYGEYYRNLPYIGEYREV